MTVNSTSTKQPSILSTILLRLQAMLAAITSTLISLLDQIIPPCRREDITSRAYAFSRSRPLLASFLASQLVFCGVPLSLLFLHVASVLFFSFATAIVIGSICALLFTAVCVGLALLVLIPILMVTSFVGLTVWFWALLGWYILGWTGLLEQRHISKMGVEKREKSDGEIGAVKEITRKMD
ncbi:hypothetical protein CIRG_02981 [Coccidioides immitis RMSCC 2394]|uniref:Uncharacterized protein n=1 Tax=Coccidioides immitis RMSCC 2394 TaxID=404692 RepID=A0A0J6Y6A7_COCIT|nr:hypothetical protein CIRG_02981 [Coccidioides immitis RMSCC 2394]